MAFIEEVVALKDDLKNGEMQQVSVKGTDVLLVRLEDRFHALHAFCTHYGAPLVGGALSEGRIICPWHHACFSAASGYQLEPPGLDSLQSYEVRIDGDDVVVRVPADASGTRTPPMSRREETDTRTFVVLGGGGAGEYAVEGLREKGFNGRLVMITREEQVPYDRPNCSKDYLAGNAPEEWMFLRGEDFYDALDVDRMHGKEVASVDAASKSITFSDGSELKCDGLILCTGGVPRSLGVPGEHLRRVFTLRSYDDSRRIMRTGQDASRAVVIGTGFIGMEVASSLKELGVGEVIVVGRGDVPFAAVLGERIGKMVREIHEENGVQFQLGHTVKEFRGKGSLESVVLDDDTELIADLAVVGIGITPATDFIEGVEKAPDGAVIVDEHLQAADGVYAAGDIAQFPYWRAQGPIRVEHWRLACQHGRLAAYNLAGEKTPYRSVPYFWTAHFGTNLRYVGYASSWDDIIYDGSPEEREFVSFYVEGDEVIAACGTGRDRDLAAIEELMRRGLMPGPEELRQGGIDYLARLL